MYVCCSDCQGSHTGEHMVHVNSHMQYSFTHDDGYQLGPPISEIQDSNLDQLDSALWADLTLLPDEMWPELEASKSSNDHIAGKLKAACYVTKAAIMFMISVEQQGSAAPRKKQKMTLFFKQS